MLKNNTHKIILLFATIITGCFHHTNNISHYMKSFPDVADKKISYPVHFQNLNNKVDFRDISISKYKLICTGYMSCGPCVARLIECENFLSRNLYLKRNLEVLFIVFGEKSEYFDYQLKHNEFSFPILFDSCSSFIFENGLENYDKSAFLVNKKNRIILMGSPFNNSVLEKYYKQCLQE